MPSNLHMVNAVDTVVHGLSMQIGEALRSYEWERHQPGPDADAMDAKIKHGETRVEKLRKIREDYENEMARPLRDFDGSYS